LHKAQHAVEALDQADTYTRKAQMISNQQNMPIEKEAKLLSVGVALDAVTYANPDLQPVEFLLK
jgi:hypothetical protein